MKLINIIEQGHWEVANIDYPNSIVKTTPKKRMSFLVHPEDRDNFFTGKGKRKLPKTKKR